MPKEKPASDPSKPSDLSNLDEQINTITQKIKARFGVLKTEVNVRQRECLFSVVAQRCGGKIAVRSGMLSGTPRNAESPATRPEAGAATG